MDLSRTIIPKSDQLNFEDVQTQSITAVIKAVRAGTLISVEVARWSNVGGGR